MSGLTVALIGGGRWGRTHASVLVQLSDRVSRVLWVSRHNSDAVEAFLAGLPGAGSKFTVVGSLDAALVLRPDAAVVVTPAADHAETAAVLLRAGVPTLVEKPLALSVDSARLLSEQAAAGGVPLLVGLHLLTAPFLHHFLRMAAGRPVAAVALEWLDPEHEIRHGADKLSNVTTHKVDEIIPHLWAILHLIDEDAALHLTQVKPLARGTVEVALGLGQCSATLRFGRRAAARKRRIQLEFREGGYAELDFTTEPGRIIIDGVEQASFVSDSRYGPLGVELAGFLDIVRSGQDGSSSPQIASRCMGAVELGEMVRTRLIEEEAGAAARLTRERAMKDPDVSAWIIDNLAPLLHVHEPRNESERRGLEKLIVEGVEAASSPARVGDDRSSPMAAKIRQTDFFERLMQGWSA